MLTPAAEASHAQCNESCILLSVCQLVKRANVVCPVQGRSNQDKSMTLHFVLYLGGVLLLACSVLKILIG